MHRISSARPGLLAAALGLMVAGPAAAQPKADNAKVAAAAAKVFETYCQKCHNNATRGDFRDLKVLAQNTDLVVPNKPDDSAVYTRALSGLTEKGGMPPSKETKRPTAPEVEAIKAWIVAGCPAPEGPPKAVERQEISTAAMMDSIEAYLRQADPADQPYLRFFTLTHLYTACSVNAKGEKTYLVSDDQLQLYRAALSEAANSMTWDGEVHVPVAIDTAQTVFAIDLRDFGWKSQAWQKMLAYYPYGLSYANNGRLGSTEKAIVDKTGSKQAYVRGDWFVFRATRPPLYHEFLNLPTSATDLEKKLGVNVPENFLRNRAARAGFVKSGVSDQHRLVERHPSQYGAYWKSYDFKPFDPAKKKVEPDLLRYPLGPKEFRDSATDKAVPSPYPDQAFEHDGGEIIFHLPNGLMGYMLVNAEDGRIDEGPIDIVHDDAKTSGSPIIVNGLSCMACHARGVKRWKQVDEDVRTQTVLNPSSKPYRKVELLYPLTLRMKGLLDKDEARFMIGKKAAVGDFLPDPGGKPGAQDDPVGVVARTHLDPISLDMVAAELGVDGPFIIRALGAQGLRELGLAGLASPAGKVKREDWEGNNPKLISPMQYLATKLGLAEPRRFSE